MTRVDLHPEDLFDHLRRGELREDERERLQRHCAACSACAFELLVVEGNAYGTEPTAGDHAIAARALERMLSSDAAEEVIPAPAKARGQLLLRAAALVLAGVLVGGSVSAAALANSNTAGWVTWIGSWVAWKAPTPASEAEPGAKLAAARKARTRPTKEARKDSEAIVAAQPPVSQTIDTTPSTEAVVALEQAAEATFTVAPSATSETTQTPRVRTPERTTRVRVPAVTSTSTASPTEQDSTPAVEAVEPAAWLFRAASRARSEGRVHEAAALYDALSRDYAGSEVEIVTRVALGRLALAQLNDPGRALAAFDSYLQARPNGALAEEARGGRVSALRKLGHDDEAQSAAEELSRLHPRTLYGGLERATP